VALMFEEITSSLAGIGVHFDRYFSERTLHEGNALAAALARLEERGHVYYADGAAWVATTAFGDDKDRVFRRSDGAYSYFGADCAYYLDKRGAGSAR
jgi:arginyl-tRNA synthetase